MNETVFDLLDDAVKAAMTQGRTYSVQVADLLLGATRQYLRHMPYDDYRKTVWWQERRRDAMVAASGRCQLCYAAVAEGFDAHHRTYDHRGFELLTDLVYLCRTCHQKFHDLFVGKDAPPLCRLCNVSMVAEQGKTDVFWFCPTGHGPIVAVPRKTEKPNADREAG